MEGFYRKEGGARKFLAKEKDYFRQSHLSLGERARDLILQITSSSWGMERAHVTEFLIDVDQKIPD